MCCVFLCLLILLNLLCFASPGCRLQVLSSHCFWCLPPVGEVGSFACVSFLLEGTGACVLVGGAGSCLSGGQDHYGGVFWGIWEVSMSFGSLSANGCGCIPVLLVFWHRASRNGACWPLGGAVSLCWGRDLWENSGQLISDGAGRSLLVQCAGVSHLGVSGPTPGWSTKTLPATWLRRKVRKKIQTNRTPNQMVNANLNRQNHTKKHTHTHSQKLKKEKSVKKIKI